MPESMACGGIDPANAFLWFSLGGILLGGGVSFILSPRRKRRPEVFIVLLSLALLSLLAALFLSGFSSDSLRFKLFWTAVSAAAGYICFLFWKAAGIPVFFLIIIFSVSLRIALFDWSCVEAGTEISSFTAISEGEDFIKIHYRLPDGGTGLVRLDRNGIYPLVRIISAPEYFFLFRTESAYIFEGFGNSPELPEITGGFNSLVVRLVTSLPGFSLSGNSGAVVISPSVEYILRFDGESRTEIKRRI